jgi:hypothetical protein
MTKKARRKKNALAVAATAPKHGDLTLTDEVKQKIQTLGTEMGETMTDRALVEVTDLWEALSEVERQEAQFIFFRAAEAARQAAIAEHS